MRLLDPGGSIDNCFLPALNSLQGALGRTSGRSYKAAPRQLLQVGSASSAGSDLATGSATNEDDVGAELTKNLNGVAADVCI